MINYDTRSLAEGIITVIEFDFLVTKRSDVLLSIVQAGQTTITFRGDNTTYLADLTFDSVLGGGIVTLVTALTAAQTIYIDLDVQEPDQPNVFRVVNNYLTSFRAIEQALDYVVTAIQTLARRSENSVKMPRHISPYDFDPELPEDIFDVTYADYFPVINDTGDGWKISAESLTSLAAQAAAALASQVAALASQVAAAVSAAAALASQLAAAVSAAAALVSETNAAASAAAAALSAGGLTGTISIDNFSGDDVTTIFNLSVNPTSENNTDVFIDGVYQQKNTYTVVGTVLTFSEAPPLGVNNIEVKMSAIIFGVPSDDSVSTVKLQDGAVSSAKMIKNVRSVTGTDTGLVTDDVILADPTGASFVFTMPAAGTVPAGQPLVIKSITTGGNYVRLQGDGAELLDGDNIYPTDLLTQDSTTWIPNGSNWHRIA